MCTYLPSEKTVLNSSELVVPADMVAVPAAFSDVQLTAASLSGVSRGPTSVRPPLRLHLLHQILLI